MNKRSLMRDVLLCPYDGPAVLQALAPDAADDQPRDPVPKCG